MFEKINEAMTILRRDKPLVLNVMNYVTMDFVANGLLSMGASPVMSHAAQDIDDLVKLAQTVVINLGTLDDGFIKLCEHACRLANQLNKPIILDPVGAGAGRYRTDTAKYFIDKYKIAIVRGNASEIMALSDFPALTKGVDSVLASLQAVKSGEMLVEKYQMAVLISGKQDVVLDAGKSQLFDRGSPLMPVVTGTGCLLSSVVGAFHAVQPDRFEAASMATVFYGVCGEMAAKYAQGPGSFKFVFLDALHAPLLKEYYDKA